MISELRQKQFEKIRKKKRRRRAAAIFFAALAAAACLLFLYLRLEKQDQKAETTVYYIKFPGIMKQFSGKRAGKVCGKRHKERFSRIGCKVRIFGKRGEKMREVLLVLCSVVLSLTTGFMAGYCIGREKDGNDE